MPISIYMLSRLLPSTGPHSCLRPASVITLCTSSLFPRHRSVSTPTDFLAMPVFHLTFTLSFISSFLWWMSAITFYHVSYIPVDFALFPGLPMRQSPSRQPTSNREKKVFRKHLKRDESRMKKSRSSPSHLQHLDDSDDEDGAIHTDVYHSLSIQVCGGYCYLTVCGCARVSVSVHVFMQAKRPSPKNMWKK